MHLFGRSLPWARTWSKPFSSSLSCRGASPATRNLLCHLGIDPQRGWAKITTYRGSRSLKVVFTGALHQNQDTQTLHTGDSPCKIGDLCSWRSWEILATLACGHQNDTSNTPTSVVSFPTSQPGLVSQLSDTFCVHHVDHKGFHRGHED